MILCFGLSPALQRIYRFESFQPGGVNRVRAMGEAAGGKAVNACRVITRLGGRCRLIHALGGPAGERVRTLLEAAGIEQTVVPVAQDTRVCTTLLSPDEAATELVEPNAPVSEGELSRALRQVEATLPGATALCLSGSIPPGVPRSLYADLIRSARDLGVRSLVDAQGDLLQKALGAEPFLAKPNLEESAAAFGWALSGDLEQDLARAAEDLTGAGAEWALVSCGKDGALLQGAGGEKHRLRTPTLAAVNAVGAGDSLAGGFLYALSERHLAVPEAAAYGVAVAAASCLAEQPGMVEKDVVEEMVCRI